MDRRQGKRIDKLSNRAIVSPAEEIPPQLELSFIDVVAVRKRIDEYNRKHPYNKQESWSERLTKEDQENCI